MRRKGLPKQIYILIGFAILLGILLWKVNTISQGPSVEVIEYEVALIQGIPTIPELIDWPPEFLEALKSAHSKLSDVETQISALARIGRLYFVNGFSSQARQCFTALQTIDSESVDWPYFKGLATLDYQDKSEAVQSLEQAARLDPSYPQIQYWLSLAYLDGGRIAESIQVAQGLLEEPRWKGWAHYILARASFSQERYEDANLEIDLALQVDPSVRAFFAFKEEVADLIGDHIGAALARARKDRIEYDGDPYDERIQAMWTYCYNAIRLIEFAQAEEAAGDLKKAENILNRAILFGEDNSAVFVALGKIRIKRGLIESGLDSFDRALEIEARNEEALLGLSEAWELKGEPMKAIETLENGIEELIQPASAYARLGDLQVNVGDREAAQKSYRSALMSDSENTAALNGLSRILLEEGDEEGSELLWQLLRREVDNEEGYIRLADFYAKRGDLDRSKSVLETGLSYTPQSAALRQRLDPLLAQ